MSKWHISGFQRPYSDHTSCKASIRKPGTWDIILSYVYLFIFLTIRRYRVLSLYFLVPVVMIAVLLVMFAMPSVRAW